MEYKTLGKTGLKVSRMGFGGIPIQKIDEEGTRKLLQDMVKRGINYIDSARGYTVSEQYIGYGLEGIRDQFVLATKSMARTKEAMAVRALYRLYLRFNEKTEENGDKIERLLPPPAAEKKKNLNRKKKEHLFWDRSADGRIRKHYRKKVLEKLKESPDAAWTPAQTASQMELEDAEEKAFAQIYEKARYAETSCTKEEMEQMLRVR